MRRYRKIIKIFKKFIHIHFDTLLPDIKTCKFTRKCKNDFAQSLDETSTAALDPPAFKSGSYRPRFP